MADDMHRDKRLNIEIVNSRLIDREGRVWESPEFPMDSDSRYTYYTAMRGICPTEVAVDTIYTNGLHYAPQGFEGVRIVRTPYGDGFVELPHNLSRLIASSLHFDCSSDIQALEALGTEGVTHLSHIKRTSRQYYADSIKVASENKDVALGFDVHHVDGSSERKEIPLMLRALCGRQIREISMAELHAATCSLAFLNNLVRYDPYPEALRQIMAGYFRHFFWVPGMFELKVPLVMEIDGKLATKPFYVAIGTLGWKRYLEDSHYANGLDLLLSPEPRSGDRTKKIGKNYPDKYLNLAKILGYGELLTINERREIVEGSAENLFFLFTSKSSGELRAFCPPLSSNILLGTTRDRMIRVLQEGIKIDGKAVELVMEAPHEKFVLHCLEEKTDWQLSAVVLVGTGVGVIHGRTITANPMLKELNELTNLCSEEEEGKEIIVGKFSKHETKYIINGGIKHPFVDVLDKAYNDFVLADNGSRIYLPYDMDPDALESVMGIGLDEVKGGEEFRQKAGSGYFKERINGLNQPDELTSRFREVGKLVRRMTKVSIEKRTSPKPNGKKDIILTGC